MKKALILLLSVLLLLSFTGCSTVTDVAEGVLDKLPIDLDALKEDAQDAANAVVDDPLVAGTPQNAGKPSATVDAPDTAQDADTEAAVDTDAAMETETVTEAETPEQVLSSLYTHLWVMNECIQETYGASFSRDVAYGRVYTSMDAMMNGEAPIDVLPRDSITEVTDGIDATLYEVSNFSTNADVRNYLCGYMTPDLVDLLFYDNFQEFNGKLYMVYGSQGYGAVYYDIDSAWIMDIGEEYCTVVVDMYYFDEYGGTVDLLFQKIDGRWYLIQYQEIYE